ncbi:MAG: hypothetical protein JXO49_11255 [Deltaproteobacteria bacterium]|nr:hypothetical protein [Candidatus Anaeroferrophillus wilburensis]MBN2889911.1 hypothetical protein [Deltaproteobacteria bacterium]
MNWKRDFTAVSRLLVAVLLAVVIVGGCAGRRLEVLSPGVIGPGMTAAVWNKLVNVETVTARGVVKLKTGDGQSASQRIRFIAQAPDRIKVQWLTPWQSVAWQLLIADRQFWLSDSNQQATYHGFLTADQGEECRQGNSWWTYIQLLAGWSQMLSRPPADPTAEPQLEIPRMPVDTVQYLVAEERQVPAGKIIRFIDGDEWHIGFDDFVAVEEGKLFPRRLVIHCSAGSMDLHFSALQINQPLNPVSLSRQQVPFDIQEINCHMLREP